MHPAEKIDKIALISLVSAVAVLVLLILMMGFMSWFGKALDVSFMTSIFTLVAMQFGWPGMYFAWRYGSSHSNAKKDDSILALSGGKPPTEPVPTPAPAAGTQPQLVAPAVV
jgi:hypothetical protein